MITAKKSCVAYDRIATASAVVIDPQPPRLQLQLELNYDAYPLIRLAQKIGSGVSTLFCRKLCFWADQSIWVLLVSGQRKVINIRVVFAQNA